MEINYISVTDWVMCKGQRVRLGVAVVDKADALIYELKNEDGNIVNSIHRNNSYSNPPYSPTKFVYGKVLIQEYECPQPDGTNITVRQLTEITDESILCEPNEIADFYKKAV